MTIEELLIEIGEPVEIVYVPRNEGNEWTVSLPKTASDANQLPVHEHFGDLREGLMWLARNGKYLAEKRHI